MSLFIVLIFALVCVLNKCESAPTSDYIEELPGFGVTPTRQYSGFLNATEGCDTNANGNVCMLHYWFVEAEEEEESTIPASKKPVVLWLNGGPGSSSLFGLLQENGPLLINSTGGFMKNPYSWTKVANLLAIEAPIGVGYSYCGNMLKKKLCQNTDKYTASASRAALVDFFNNKFPEYKGNDFFITGESYAGIYVPTLAKEILDNAKDSVPLVGLAVGDPCTDTDAQNDSMDAIWYGHKYGLIQDQEFDFLWNKCGARHSPFLANDDKAKSVFYYGGKWAIRRTLKQYLHLDKHNDDSHDDVLDKHNKYQTKGLRTKIHKILKDHFFHHSGPGPNFQSSNATCRMAYRKFLISTSDGLSQSWADQWINDYSLFSAGGLTSEDEYMAKWMMRDEVQRALHVETSPADAWPLPSQGFDYTSEYAACNVDFDPGTPSMINIYREIAPKLDVTLIYNGDTDPCLSYEGTAIAISRVGFNEVDGGGYRPWFYNHTASNIKIFSEKSPLFGPDLLAQPTGPQFGGEIVNYEHNLSFATVHGSGHMVPQFRPQAALHMLTKVLKRKDFTPLMPNNATLRDMSDEEFDSILSKWTEKAKESPYVSEGRNHQELMTSEFLLKDQ